MFLRQISAQLTPGTHRNRLMYQRHARAGRIVQSLAIPHVLH